MRRSVYERGLGFVGSDWAAQSLWKKYAAFEAGVGAPLAAAQVYRRALGRPLRDLDMVMTRCGAYR